MLLLAPAGYGKTTLARQWQEQSGASWVSVTPASPDVPVLARDIASAIAAVAELDLRRVETALGAGQSPVDQARTVARTILTQIRMPIETWIAIDDYHLLIGTPAEELVEALERSGRFRFLVTSRERPAWATSRRRVHLETLEIGAPELALDDAEIAKLLPADRRTAGLRRQARGWPAVIALAAHAGASDLTLTADAISATLYDYFAEELFERASSVVQRCLATIAVLPPLEPDELGDLLEVVGAADRAVSTGLAYEADGRIEVHPLARAFLVAKLRGRDDALEVAQAGVDLALAEGLYDHAFELIKEFHLDDSLEPLITTSYSALIENGRIATLAGYARYAGAHGNAPQHLLDLIAAEVALVEGRFELAYSLGNSAAECMVDGHSLKARGYNIAGRAALLRYRYDDAFTLHSTAMQYAISIGEKNDAAWGRFLAGITNEEGRVDDALKELEALSNVRPTDRVRLTLARTSLSFRNGKSGFRQEEPAAAGLMAEITDPWVRSGWANTFGYALILQARYGEARLLIRSTLSELGVCGFGFGTPHLNWSLAAAELGLRHFSRCDALLRKVEHHDGFSRDLHLQLNARALRARLELAQHRPAVAVDLTRDDFESYPSRAMYGEYLATRALALATTGETQLATATADRAADVTRALDTKVMCAAVRAIATLEDPPSRGDAAESLLRTANELAAWDGVVCAIRAVPALLVRLALIPRHGAELRDVLVRSHDVRLAKSVGLITRSTGSRRALSPRECEIMEQVAQGRRNAEIARAFFISPGTVKSHLDHIYDKLGVRSRAAAVARYAESENAGADDESGDS